MLYPNLLLLCRSQSALWKTGSIFLTRAAGSLGSLGGLGPTHLSRAFSGNADGWIKGQLVFAWSPAPQSEEHFFHLTSPLLPGSVQG